MLNNHGLLSGLTGLASSLLALGAAAAPAPAPEPGPPAQWQHGVFMEIFVRGYQDGQGRGHGDLRGLVSRLDYLQELGVSGLWLMPITVSADHDHGYAITDFRRVEPDYGTLEDFDRLIREAHRRGIGVIADHILNHSAREHPLFQASASSPRSPLRDWYVWADPATPDLKDWDIWGKNPWYAQGGSRYFATFGAGMPDFNLRNPAVVAYHEDSLRYWLDRGLDGFRLDAVPHLIENNAHDWNDQPESRALTASFTRLIKRYPGRYVVCEATASPTDYGAPTLCGSAFAFGLERQIIAAAQGHEEAVPQVARYFEHAPLSMATMLANHDIFAGRRIWDQMQGDEARYKLAAATYLLLPGTPFIYYGEEIGMAGVGSLPGDGPLRAPMSWTPEPQGFSPVTPTYRPASPNIATHNVQTERSDPNSLLNFYKTVIALRRQQPCLAQGGYARAFADGGVLGFERDLGKQRCLVLINYGQQRREFVPPGLAPTQSLQPLWSTDALTLPRPLPAGKVTAEQLSLPKQSVSVFLLR